MSARGVAIEGKVDTVTVATEDEISQTVVAEREAVDEDVVGEKRTVGEVLDGAVVVVGGVIVEGVNAGVDEVGGIDTGVVLDVDIVEGVF